MNWTDFKHQIKKGIFSISMFLLIVLIFLYFAVSSITKERNEEENRTKRIENDLNDIKKFLAKQDTAIVFRHKTIQGLFYILQDKRIIYPEIFTQVAIQESGWCLCSDMAVNANNLFGFIYVADSTRNIGEYYGHSKYKDWNQAIEDLRFWIKSSPPYPMENPYAYLVRRGYNPKGWDYVNAVKQHKFWEIQ